MNFENIGLNVPKILLPNKTVDLSKWAVVACDQYTSQPEYWNAVKNLVGSAPSTYHITLPEIYLESPQEEEMIANINKNMNEYLKHKILEEQKPGFILVDRKTSHVASRKGLMVALDLEHYDFNKGSQTLIRATEGTVIERLPPRIKIRQNASIELPHIMVLIDDPEQTVIEPLFKMNLPKVYDFELMMNGGHIKGYKIEDEKLIKQIAQELERLGQQDYFNKKYGVSDKGVLLYAVGDGNHSLATAKSIWEKLKKEAKDKQAIMNSPARYALVELVNVHDAGITFEPIHRVVFNVDVEEMLEEMKSYYHDHGSEFSYELFDKKEKIKESSKHGMHVIPFIYAKGSGVIRVKNPKLNLEVGTLQSFLDEYLKQHKQSKIDYIHGDEVVKELGTKENNIGLFLPVMGKQELFKTVIVDGVLPRKTFSMGEAEEKRFYLECRKIV